MPKRHPSPKRKQPTRSRRKPYSVFRPAEPRSQTPQQQLIQREEESICKRIIQELGFAPQTLSALREFRQMHSPDVE